MWWTRRLPIHLPLVHCDLKNYADDKIYHFAVKPGRHILFFFIVFMYSDVLEELRLASFRLYRCSMDKSSGARNWYCVLSHHFSGGILTSAILLPTKDLPLKSLTAALSTAAQCLPHTDNNLSFRQSLLSLAFISTIQRHDFCPVCLLL